MPPRRPSRPPPPHHHHEPPSRVASSGLSTLAAPDGIAALLVPWLPDAEDRAFVARCIATEGPTHHRIASAALLRLLGLALEAAGGAEPGADVDGVAVPFRLPPHLERHADEDAQYPLKLPRRALERLAPAGSREAAAIADAMTDGPPHHALANVAMVCLLDALLERLSKKDGA